MSAVKKPLVGEIVECRSHYWRVVTEDNQFYKLERIPLGPRTYGLSSYVWAHKEIEQFETTRLDQVLCPQPTSNQVMRSQLWMPFNDSLKWRYPQTNQDIQTSCYGAIDIKSWQFIPWQRIHHSLPFPRLLLADDVGLGKTTEVAIIISELNWRGRAERVLIITPQQLTNKWQNELFGRFGLAFEIFNRDTRERLVNQGVKNPFAIKEKIIVSKDFLRRWENLRLLQDVEWDLIVVDECHHFFHDENGGVTRLRELLETIAPKSPGLILVSATPHSGNQDEFRSLLQLIDPAIINLDQNNRSSWQKYIIRRVRQHLMSEEQFVGRKMELQDIKLNEKCDEAQLLQECKIFLDQLRDSNNFNANHLQIETLKKRLSSSWRAFYRTLERRVDSSARKKNRLIDKLIGYSLDPNKSAKIIRLKSLIKDIWNHGANLKLVVFTEYVDTAEYIVEGLREWKECTALITGSTPDAERLRIEQQFADPRSSLKILVTTDTSAEGKDFQHACYHLIHFELPWSLIKFEQRNGRIDRLGQTQSPQIYALVLNHEATSDQKVMQRLIERIDTAKRDLDSVHPLINSISEDQIRELVQTSADIESIDKLINQHKDVSLKFTQAFEPNKIPEKKKTSSYEFAPLSEDFAKGFELKVLSLQGNLKAIPNSPEWNLILPHSLADHIQIPWHLEVPKVIWDQYGFPSSEDPWRVTFDRQRFLNYERYRIQGHVIHRPLIYLHPFHPVVQIVDKYFQIHMNQKGYPVFFFNTKANNSEYMKVLLEITLYSPKGSLIERQLVVWDAERKEFIDPSCLHVIQVAQAHQIESNRFWRTEELHRIFSKKVREVADQRSKELELKKNQFIKSTQYMEDHSNIQHIQRLQTRNEWIERYWSIDPQRSFYQVIAVLLPKKD